MSPSWAAPCRLPRIAIALGAGWRAEPQQCARGHTLTRDAPPRNFIALAGAQKPRTGSHPANTKRMRVLVTKEMPELVDSLVIFCEEFFFVATS